MSELSNLFNERIAHELAIGKSQHNAVRIACEAFGRRAMSAPNSRRHCQRARGLLRRVDELRAIMNEKALDGLQGTRDWILRRLYAIADAELDDIRTSDQIQAMRLAAQITGNMAPDKVALTNAEGEDVVLNDAVRHETARHLAYAIFNSLEPEKADTT